jgi:transposase
LNGNDVGATLLGLEGFRVLTCEEDDGELYVLVETTAEVVGCPDCGVRAKIKERPRVQVRDVAVAGRAMRLVWRKRRWCCPDPGCERGSWRERCEQIAPRAVLTERARADILTLVGEHGGTVAAAARIYGVGWGTAWRAVEQLGGRLVDDVDRIGDVRALGVDETSWLTATREHPTLYVSGLVDLDRGLLLDVVENRTARAVTAWLAARPPRWRRRVKIAALDPYAGYKTALTSKLHGLPEARLVVDHWHAIRLANQMVDEVRRRVQRHTTGHRGRADDPLYKIRRLLLIGAERLDPRGYAKLEAGLAAGDPYDEVGVAWMGKELLRRTYAAADLDEARGRLVEFYQWAAQVDVPELVRLASTIERWQDEVLAYWTTGGYSNAKTEAMNLNIKAVKRAARGFRRFRNYRLRLLLRCGVIWNTPPTAQVRSRRPPLAA